MARNRLHGLSLVGVTACLVGVQSFAAGDIQASCGDWLAHPKPTRAEQVLTPRLTERIGDPPAPRSPMPCLGPACRPVSDPPFPATPPVVGTTGDDVCRELGDSGDSAPPSGARAIRCGDDHPRCGFPLGILRPPCR